MEAKSEPTPSKMLACTTANLNTYLTLQEYEGINKNLHTALMLTS